MLAIAALDYNTVEYIADNGPAYISRHLDDVRGLARDWGHYLQLTNAERELFERAAFLHDIGKMVIPEPIVCKVGRLTNVEYKLMQQHVRMGAQMLRGYVSEDVVLIVLQHHERIDGQGYPFGMLGSQIHPLSRRLAIIDAYSAMTEGRRYRVTLTEGAAIEELQRCAGTQFDREFVTEFVKWRRWIHR